MKSIIHFLLAMTVLTVFNTSTFAQSSIGLRGGFSMFTLKNFPAEAKGEGVTEGLIFGNSTAISYEIGISKVFAIQPEFNYIQKGGKIRLPDQPGFSMKVKTDYLELPLLAKFRLGSGNLKGYLTLGPSIGYALVGQSTLRSDGVSVSDKIVFDDSFRGDGRKDNRIDLGAVGGGGIQYKLGPGSIVLDARLALDLNDNNRYENGRPAGFGVTHSQGLSVSLGYQFEFGSR